jgi:hypothetical protein
MNRDGRWTVWVGLGWVALSWSVVGASFAAAASSVAVRLSINPPQPNPNLPQNPVPAWVDPAWSFGSPGATYGPLLGAIVGGGWALAVAARYPAWRPAALALGAASLVPLALQIAALAVVGVLAVS